MLALPGFSVCLGFEKLALPTCPEVWNVAMCFREETEDVGTADFPVCSALQKS